MPSDLWKRKELLIMDKIILTSLTPDELREIIREELEVVLRKIDTKIEDPASDVLSIEKAAELLKLSKTTIYGLVNRRSIPHSKKGKRLYFSKDDLIEWMKSGKRRTRQEIENSL